MPRRLFTSFLALSILSTLVVAALVVTGNAPLRQVETRCGDLLARQGRRAAADPRLLFLAIDSASMLDEHLDLDRYYGLEGRGGPEVRALRLMCNQWPWPRSLYALVLDRLFAAGARVVVFDLNFPMPSDDPAADAEFRAALDRYRGRVVIGSNFVEESTHPGVNSAWAYTRPTRTLIPLDEPAEGRVGYVNFWSDEDATVRQVLYAATRSEIAGVASEPGEPELLSLSAQAVRAAGWPELIPHDGIPRSFRLAGNPQEGFPPQSLAKIFAPESWARNWQNGQAFQDAIVVIGAAGDWQHDIHLTALGAMPGPEIQLNAINALLQGAFLHEAPAWAPLVAVLLAGLLAWASALAAPAPAWRVALLLALGLGWWAAAGRVSDRSGLLLPLAPPLVLLALAGFAGLVHDLILTRGDRRRLRGTLERYVSRNLVQELLEKPDRFTSALGGAVRPVTILFSDIRNFTRLCAQAEPRQLVDLLNEYLTAMVECAFRYRGTLDKFIGDAVMVVWGNACTDGPEADARNAVACARAMREELEKLNRRWASEGRPEIRIGIALNHGKAVVGNIGSPHRMEFTVIGDAVNVCWRLQERTKLHGDDLLLGEAMLPLLGAGYDCEELGTLMVGETVGTTYARLARVEKEERREAGRDAEARETFLKEAVA